MPAATPETIPVADPTVATDGVPLLHVPPPASLNVVVDPTQTVSVPAMVAGSGLTVKGVVE